MKTELRTYQFKFTESFEPPLLALLSQLEFSNIRIEAESPNDIWIKIEAKTPHIQESQFMSDILKVGKVLGNIGALQQQWA